MNFKFWILFSFLYLVAGCHNSPVIQPENCIKDYQIRRHPSIGPNSLSLVLKLNASTIQLFKDKKVTKVKFNCEVDTLRVCVSDDFFLFEKDSSVEVVLYSAYPKVLDSYYLDSLSNEIFKYMRAQIVFSSDSFINIYKCNL